MLTKDNLFEVLAAVVVVVTLIAALVWRLWECNCEQCLKIVEMYK